MEQVDNREKTFRFELGDGAYIVGKDGNVTIVAKNINIIAGDGVVNIKGGIINLNSED